MKKTSLIILSFLSLGAIAQKKNTQPWFASTITAQDLKKHLYVIASKEMEGRNTPSPGLEKAATYIENHFKSLGLTPGNGDSYRQYYNLYKDSMTASSVSVNGTSYQLLKDFRPSVTINHSADLGFSEAVFVGYGIVDDNSNAYKDLDVAGKLVILLEGMPTGYKSNLTGLAAPFITNNKINNAQMFGAAAVLVVTENVAQRFSPVSRFDIYQFRDKLGPQTFYISQSVAEKIMGEDGKDVVKKMKTTPMSAKAYKANIELKYTKTTKAERAPNVLGLLEGTDKKDEYIILTAHYDHEGKVNDSTIYYGADDDGSGTVSILELAEAFAKAKAAGKGPRRSILFMTVSGEEKGLLGSEYYANNPVYPLEKSSVNLNIDMIGRTGSEYKNHADSANYIYVIGDDKLSSDLTPITEGVNSKYTKLKLDRKYNDPNDPNRFYFRSDHYNFAQKGVPIIFYFNGTHADYHRITDTPDKINYKLMAKRAQLVFHTAWEMANKDAMLKRDIQLEKPKGF